MSQNAFIGNNPDALLPQLIPADQKTPAEIAAAEARALFGDKAPDVSSHQHLGEMGDGRSEVTSSEIEEAMGQPDVFGFGEAGPLWTNE